MTLGEPAMAPIGFLDFCTRRPQDCRSAVSARADASTGPAAAPASAHVIMTSATDGMASGVQFLPIAATDADRAQPAADRAALAAGPAGGAAAPLHLSSGLMDRLSELNLQVNRAIRPVSDMVSHGVPDHWDLPFEEGETTGDCEDYALEKQHTLIRQGVPAEDLSLAVVRTSWGEEHAVLLVSTDGGELVMDNLSPRVRSWRDVDYRWIERQVPGQPMNWVAIGG